MAKYKMIKVRDKRGMCFEVMRYGFDQTPVGSTYCSNSCYWQEWRRIENDYNRYVKREWDVGGVCIYSTGEANHNLFNYDLVEYEIYELGYEQEGYNKWKKFTGPSSIVIPKRIHNPILELEIGEI